jgi:hypothetical protein
MMEARNEKSPECGAQGFQSGTEKTDRKSFSHGAAGVNGQAADPLLPHHRAMLEASALSPGVMNARGYRSITDAKELLVLEFAPRQVRVPGLLLPLHTTDGIQPFSVYRPDDPRIVGEKAVKYEFPENKACVWIVRRSAGNNWPIRKFRSGSPKARRKLTR